MSQTSTIDPTQPSDQVQVDKALIRAQFQSAYDEINDLYRKQGYIYQVMVGLTTMLA